MKFEDCPDLAEGMGRMMGRELKRAYPLLPFDGICYLPMTRKDIRKRGYCQTLLLAKAVQKETGLPLFKKAVTKTRQTKSQHLLDRQQRLVNLTGAFCANSEQIKGKRIILCDDLTTTGATIAECSKALYRSGAQRVLALTFARAKSPLEKTAANMPKTGED